MPSAQRRVRDLKLSPSAHTTAGWNGVSAAVRNTSFFSACVEDERLLGAIQKLVDQAIEEGWSVTAFIDRALTMLDDIRLERYPGSKGRERGQKFDDSFDILYDMNRLRLIYLTQKQLAAGFRLFVDAFDPFTLQVFPAWEFYRQPGAKEQYKRTDHVKHEGVIRLKTDLPFWLARNRAEIGGFGNPYGPWGFNSWMRTDPVDRERAEELGLIKPGEKLVIPAEYAEWNIGNVIQNIGTASVTDLLPEQRQNVVDRCEEEGIKVEEEEDTLHVVPSEDPQDPLNVLEEENIDDWLQREQERLDQMSEEEILNEILNVGNT